MSAAVDDDAPLLDDVARAFAPDRPATLGVALSGGGDSLALLHLALRVAAARGQSVRAVTVDHGLRPDAAREARFAADAAIRLGAGHDVLHWRRAPGPGNLQDQARRARAALIAGWARSRGIDHVALGHTADDQAETLLMGLARGAGVDGLAGMRPRWRDGIDWSRPLLDRSRGDLRAYLTRHGESWIDDPSNDDTRFDRVKARRALALLAPLGITVDALGRVARNMAGARRALDRRTAELARELATWPGGDVLFERRALLDQDRECRRRLLIGALRFVAGGAYPPRAAAIAALEAAIRDGRDATLAGCLVTITGDAVRITRELAALRDVRAMPGALWDGRWILSGPATPDAECRALTPAGLLACHGWRDAGPPRPSLLASPAIWSGNRLIAAPLAGNAAGWTASLAPMRDDFSLFLLSH